MKRHKEKVKKGIARLMLAAFILQMGAGTSQAAPIQIPTGDIDLTILATILAGITNAQLVTWRTGTPNQPPQTGATKLTMEYMKLVGANGLVTPTRALSKDNSCNNQGDCWFDNAIQLDFKKGNSLSTAILIYSSNSVTGADDPLGNVALRGGLVGCTVGQTVVGTAGNQTMSCPNANDPARTSVIPLIWKAASTVDLVAVSSASATSTPVHPITTAPLYMPTEIVDAAAPGCLADGPYNASTRPVGFELGFCDYSTHYFVDRNSTDPNNMFYDKYPTTGPSATPQTIKKHSQSFDYSSLVGPFGVNTTEQGVGAGQFNPMFAVLGTNLANAIQAHYGTTIYVEVLAR